LENDYYFKLSAWNQAQRLADQALLSKSNADLAGLNTNILLNATELTA
jgi:hypothetical protein